MPHITVIVTVYNIAKYLDRFFESFLSQSFSDFKLLMIDDGSRDDSLTVCKKWANKDSRIEIVELEHVGIAKARNIAMGYIDTEFTAYADGDDYVEKDYLKHLVEAQKKYNADLVISRVIYRTEKNEIMGVFVSRGEVLISQEKIPGELPGLLDERRLNYLYGKLYRSSCLKNIRVENDVKQGSDTMINCQVVSNVRNIVLIDDMDYNYIKYNTRSVTSYGGTNAFERLLRINKFVYQEMQRQDFLTVEMSHVIDKRILLSAIWVIDRLMNSEESQDAKIAQIDAVLSNSDYRNAMSRYEEQPWDLGFKPIRDKNGTEYVNRISRKEKINSFKAGVIKRTPQGVHNLYRRLLRKQ